MLITILSFALVAGIIITIHEFGHFIAARLTGMRVKKFSIGFPPRLFTRKYGDTEFSVSWIPLGGFVQIAGMVDESLDGEGITGAPDEFMSKNAAQKIFVLSAGVIMNYVTAILILFGLTLAVGIPEVESPLIGEAVEGRPAATSGLAAGDRIIEIDGRSISTWQDVVETITAAGDTVHLVAERDGKSRPFAIPTESVPAGDSTRRVIGISPQVEFRAAGLGEAGSSAVIFCWNTTKNLGQFVGDLVTGTGSLSQLSGPVGVAQLSGRSARQGAGEFLFFIAFVSVSIGFLNILPFPVLDGGHIVIVLIEALIRRPIPSRAKIVIQQAGMIALLMLFVVVSYHDIVRLIGG
ncbi:MAG: RIP metalloprotease RseP [Calditrichaeota bacterium]|nr:RIP metalloprotease RseP [Calditrichota bacterium]MCB9366377.1 RIP metalloprotease RseP [Calditrichota bacterium]MCB9391993.1 RIP metalloprotease RseP [Calditrichota bacterium]